MVLVLERSDRTALMEISLREMEKGRGGSGALVTAWWRVGEGQVRTEVGLMAVPPLEPTISGRNRKRKITLVPNPVKRRSFDNSFNQAKELTRGDTGTCDEMGP